MQELIPKVEAFLKEFENYPYSSSTNKAQLREKVMLTCDCEGVELELLTFHFDFLKKYKKRVTFNEKIVINYICSLCVENRKNEWLLKASRFKHKVFNMENLLCDVLNMRCFKHKVFNMENLLCDVLQKKFRQCMNLN